MTPRRPYPRTVKSAAFLFFLAHPGANAKRILEAWSTHEALRDYKRPDEQMLTVWVEEFVARRNEHLYRDSYKAQGRREEPPKQNQAARDAKGRFLAPWPLRGLSP